MACPMVPCPEAHWLWLEIPAGDCCCFPGRTWDSLTHRCHHSVGPWGEHPYEASHPHSDSALGWARIACGER